MKKKLHESEIIGDYPELMMQSEWSTNLLTTYEDWKGSGVLKSMPMLEHMKAVILRDFPWHMISYLKKHSPNEVV